jgi:hypothetical protein
MQQQQKLFELGTKVRFQILDVEHVGTVLRRHGDSLPPQYVIADITPPARGGPQVSCWWHELHAVDAPPRRMRFKVGDHVRMVVGGRLRQGVVLKVDVDVYVIHRLDPPDALGVPIRATDDQLAEA